MRFMMIDLLRLTVKLATIYNKEVVNKEETARIRAAEKERVKNMNFDERQIHHFKKIHGLHKDY